MRETGRPRVFVVDDEHTIAFTLTTILENSGFAATAFTNPLEALQAAEKDCPDLMVADVLMPKLNGIDLGVRFKELYPQCKVLLLSGQGFKNEKQKSGDGRYGFELLPKPFHPKDMIAAVRAMTAAEQD